MFVVEDPLLSCILRFVTDIDRSDADNQAFLRRQIKALKLHLLQFPPDQQQHQAMEWVLSHAAGYRRNWENRTVSQESFELRCIDCPLTSRGAAEHCEIHEQWLYLLRRYMQGEIQSRDYLEHALDLLQQHKDILLKRMPAPPANAALDTQSTNKKKAKGKKKKKKRPKKKAKQKSP